MIAGVSDLLKLLDRYVRGEMALEAMHDQLSLSLQEFFDNASEEGVELLSEIHSALYEVEDGVLPEEEFRSALHKLIQDQTRAA